MPTEQEAANRPGECSYSSAKTLLSAFVHNRNAALLPKPIDPRREKIAKALCGTWIIGGTVDVAIVDRILAALDTKE